MRFKLLLLLTFGILFGGALSARELPHDFHVSIMTIDCNAKTGSLEITLKIFTDDLEKSILSLGGPKLAVGATGEDSETDQFIFKYLQNRLSFEVNGKLATPKWVGKEVEMDATWCYLEIRNVGELNQIILTNRILLEIFADQSNLVHVNCQGETKSIYLRKGFVQDKIEF